MFSPEKQREMAGKKVTRGAPLDTKNAARFIAADLGPFYAFMMLTFSRHCEEKFFIELLRHFFCSVATENNAKDKTVRTGD